MGEYVIGKWRVFRGPVTAVGVRQFAAYLDVYAAADAEHAKKLASITVQFDGTATSFRAAVVAKVAKIGNAAVDAAEAAADAALSQLAAGG